MARKSIHSERERACKSSSSLAPWLQLACVLLASTALGCQTAIMHAGVALYYEEAPQPNAPVERGLAYSDFGEFGEDGGSANSDKHRLDLFMPAVDATRPVSGAVPGIAKSGNTSSGNANSAQPPAPAASPVLIFVHGGGWTSGDRNYAVGDADVYANIGRYFASKGILTAVISYRLQPKVSWRDQVEDVASAVRWVRENAASRGGDPDLLFLSGHSAGSHLTMRLALDRAWLAQAGIPEESICGLLPVSGAGYDLADDLTYELGASRAYFEARFADGAPDWQQNGSVLPLVRRDVPPTLIVYGAGETGDLVRQSQHLAAEMRAAGAPTEVLEMPGESHYRMALTISHAEKRAAPTMAAFIRNNANSCAAARSSEGDENA